MVLASVIPSAIPDYGWANFPRLLQRLCECRNGLIVFSGVGVRKNHINGFGHSELLRRESQRVVTIEDPIEYILQSSGDSLITQREVNRDVKSFADGLKYAMQQDPNLILVREIRDEETARMALSAAETDTSY